MDNKPFDLVSIILVMMLALAMDVLDLFAWLVFGIPAIGQIFYFGNVVASFFGSAAINLLFIIKLGKFGRAGIANVAGGIANVIGIPGVTFTTAAAILLANSDTARALAGAATGKIGAVSGVAKRALAGAATGKVGMRKP